MLHVSEYTQYKITIRQRQEIEVEKSSYTNSQNTDKKTPRISLH